MTQLDAPQTVKMTEAFIGMLMCGDILVLEYVNMESSNSNSILDANLILAFKYTDSLYLK